RHLTDLFPNLNATVMGVHRDGEMRIIHSHEQMIAGDQAIVAVARDQVQRVLGLFGRDEAPPARVVIAGAGNVGRYVARRIEEKDPSISIRIIESNRDNAQRAAETMQHAIVVYGDALSADIMREVD